MAPQCSQEVLNGLRMSTFHCDFPITANAAGPGSWEMPVALPWQARGIRKMDGRPAGAWKSRGESPPTLVCVWFSETSKQVFIPGSQAPCLSTCALGQNLSESAQARLHLCSVIPGLSFPRFLSSTNHSSSKSHSDFFFYLLYLDIKTQHFSPLKKLNWSCQCSKVSHTR